MRIPFTFFLMVLFLVLVFFVSKATPDPPGRMHICPSPSVVQDDICVPPPLETR